MSVVLKTPPLSAVTFTDENVYSPYVLQRQLSVTQYLYYASVINQEAGYFS